MKSLSNISGMAASNTRISIGPQVVASATVFASSACILVVELVAGRLISRFVGQSLYTWTGIIAVVLAGISIGNYLGGRIADRRSGPGTLALQFMVAALACLSVLAANRLAGGWETLSHLAWSARILTHITLTFLLPCIVLGTISPVVAKRALAAGRATGRTMGDVYAWATAGSIVGTFVTGYYLVMWLGVTTLVTGAAALLFLIGLVYAAWAFLSRETSASASSQTQPASNARADGLVERDRAAWAKAIGTVLLASACVMAMEVAAGRLIARDYGQSLYTWTTVIGVVLAGMSLGSYLGGRLADRFDLRKTICVLFILSSVSCLAAPLVNMILVYNKPLADLSWPMQIAAHCTAAFFLPSILLGAIPPIVAKMALLLGRDTGRTVGNVYAWGSVGSIVGTLAAGYFAIATFGMMYTLCLVTVLLAFGGLMYGLRSIPAWLWTGLAVTALATGFVPLPSFNSASIWLGLRPIPVESVVYTAESQYSYIYVMNNPDEENVRSLVLDHLVHSKIDMVNPLNLHYEYEWVYTAVLDKYYPPDRPITALVIGGGGYSYPHYLELTRPGGYVEVAEIDPAVTEAAHAACALPRDTSLHVFHMDARNRVEDLVRQKRAGQAVPVFDCVFGDSINDYSVPYHLTTLEFTRNVAELLSPDGIYQLNLIDMLTSGRFLAGVVRTCREVFPNVYVFSCSTTPTKRDTFIVVSSKRPLDLADLPERTRAQHPYEGVPLETARLDALIARTGNVLLTDDFAPVDNMVTPVVVFSQDTHIADLIERAHTVLDDNQNDEAFALSRKILRRGVISDDAHEIIGIVLYRKGDVPGAIDELGKAIEINPYRATAYHHLARALVDAGRLQEAIAAWRKALEIDPKLTMAVQGLGSGLLLARDYAGATGVLKKALDLDDASAPTHNNLAVALFQTNDLQGAIIEFEKALEIDPAYQGVRPQLAIALYRVKNYDQAWEQVRQCRLAKEPLDPRFVQDLERDSGRTQ